MEKEKPQSIDPDLLEYLAEKQYLQEPFSRALLYILIEKGICTNTEVMDMLDKVITGDLKRGMEKWHDEGPAR